MSIIIHFACLFIYNFLFGSTLGEALDLLYSGITGGYAQGTKWDSGDQNPEKSHTR